MTSISMHSQSFKPARPLGFGSALRAVAVGTTRFGASLLQALRRPTRAHRRLSLLEEANQVRELAARMQATDPGFAQDLFAAANRHELDERR